MDSDNKQQVTNKNLHKHQRSRGHCAYVKDVNEEEGQRRCLNQSKWHQFGVANKLMGI
jgi:hypothetical protein